MSYYMLPVLLSIGPLTIYTLGFLLGSGYFLAAFIIWRRLKELGIKEEMVVDFIISTGISGIFFSRVFFIFENFEKFGFSPERWLFLGRYPGLSFMGAVLGMFLSLFWFSKKQKRDFWRIGDEITFGILPFLILAQIGSFFDGSGQGRPTTMPWGMYFLGSLLRRQPLCLFSAIFLFLIWLFILRIERQWRIWEWYKSKADGFILLVFSGLLMLSNFLLAFWRDSKIYFLWLEVILSLVVTVLAGVIFYSRSGRKLKFYGK